MNCIIISQPGAPEVLQLAERPTPQPQNGEVLIRVMAAGVNRPDVAQRKGSYPPPPGAPRDIPGLEIAGVIAELGPGCTRFQVGDRVCALVIGGGYAEFCTAPEGQCLPIPGELLFTDAASLPETFFTVWSNVYDRAKLQPGETLLVHGGSSGIGITAIQMGKATNNPVYVTAGSDEKCRFCEALGATKAINYKTDDFKTAIANLTDGKGVDVILDMIGGDYTQRNIQSLADEGRLVMINMMNGKDVALDLSTVMRKRLYITGSMLRSRDTAFKAAIAGNLEKYIWPMIAAGVIRPVVYQVFPLADAAGAHQLMESSEHMGKIVLKVGDED